MSVTTCAMNGGRAGSLFAKPSPGLKMISLTATPPPYEGDPALWGTLYPACGEIDEEITVPELVNGRDPLSSWTMSTLPFQPRKSKSSWTPLPTKECFLATTDFRSLFCQYLQSVRPYVVRSA